MLTGPCMSRQVTTWPHIGKYDHKCIKPNKAGEQENLFSSKKDNSETKTLVANDKPQFI